MRIVFMGTPQFSVPALEALIASKDHDVVAVYSQPPKPSGRGHKVTKTPIHQVAESHGIPVFTPKSLRKPEPQEDFNKHDADIAIVAAYGLILPKEILEAPKFGCVNIHASLLPRWRGAAPIQRAIEAGDQESGITLMQMDEGLDTGDMLAKETVPITANMTSSDLHDALSDMGGKMLLPLLAEHPNWHPESQDESLVTYAHKLEKSESRIDFQEDAALLDRKIRAFSPWPGTQFSWAEKFSADTRIKILSAQAVLADDTPDHRLSPGEIYCQKGRLIVGCGSGCLEILSLQIPGKKPMNAEAFINGYQIKSGDSIK